MRWLEKFTKKTVPEPVPERRDIALFPLKAVLFPDGALALKVFEARYLDMVAACMKAEEAFGVCLIARGSEVGTAAPHPVGTLARIVAWHTVEKEGAERERSEERSEGKKEEGSESGTPNLLYLEVRGGRRFRILEQRAEANGLLRAEVEFLPEHDAPIPPPQERLLPLLREVAASGGTPIPEPHRWESAAWVGYRFCEIVPVQALAKQKLLELDDPVSRLEILDRYLEQHGLVR